MNKNKETFETWNKLADLYQEKFMYIDKYDATYDSFCAKLVKANSRILDVGTGPGNIPNYLLNKMPKLQIEGIDISENMIEKAKINIPSGAFAVMDSRDIQKLDGLYDGIICGFCIPYLTSVETEKLISNAFDLLNDGGTFYLSFVEGKSELSGWKSNSIGDRVYFHYHLLDAVKEHFNKVGFQNWEVMQVSYDNTKNEEEIHTIILGQK